MSIRALLVTALLQHGQPLSARGPLVVVGSV